MNYERDILRMFHAAMASSQRRDDWAATVRNFEHAVDGVACNLHVKVQLIWQRMSTAPRLTGECFVFLSAATDGDLVGGSGWAHFALSEAGARGAWHLFAMALDEALAELRSKPEFASLAEGIELRDAVAPVDPAPRRARRI